MASIRKRGSNSYLIVVSRGYDYEGNRLKSVQKTVKPPKEYTPKQAEKWVKEQAILFEREVQHAAHGGLPYFCAYMIAMIIGECINFPIQRSFVFRSKGNLAKQISWYLLAFCVITCIVNSINCVWVAVAGLLVPDFIYNIGTTVLNGGVSMVIFFFVNKIIFPEGAEKH